MTVHCSAIPSPLFSLSPLYRSLLFLPLSSTPFSSLPSGNTRSLNCWAALTRSLAPFSLSSIYKEQTQKNKEKRINTTQDIMEITLAALGFQLAASVAALPEPVAAPAPAPAPSRPGGEKHHQPWQRRGGVVFGGSIIGEASKRFVKRSRLLLPR